MNSAIESLSVIMVWVLATCALLPIGLAAMRVIWHGEDQESRETSLIAAFVAAPFVFAGLCWLANWYGVVSLSSSGVRMLGCVCVLLAFRFLKGAFPAWQRCAAILGLYAAVFIGWTAFRLVSPEIFWGEKPMDFSFLNYLIRSEALPPDDPWAAGHPLNYYYFGHFTWALFHKLTGIDSAIGYNLALSAVGSGLFMALWCVLRTLKVANGVALLGSAVIALGSNLEWVRFLLSGERALGFDHFWATSRLLTSPAITEYPSWSVMFGDLHAHVIALPLSALCYGVMLQLTVGGPRNRSGGAPGWLLLGGLEALLYATNSWELIPHSGFYVLCLATIVLSAERESVWHSGVRILFALSSVALGALIFIVPWLIALGETVEIGYGWVVKDYATAWQVSRHFGQFLIPIALAFFAGLITWPGRKVSVWGVSLTAAVAPIGLAFYISGFAHVSPPFGLITACGVLIFIGTAKLLLSRDVAVGVLLAASGALIALCELVYVMDHTNTLFKLYLSIWMWLGLLAVIAIGKLLQFSSVARHLRWCGLSCFALALAGAGVNVYSLVLSDGVARGVLGPRPTLNGMRYLETRNPDEARLVFWMRRNISGVPVIAEAIGDSYREFGRIAMNTGLPAVIGWDYHVAQRAVAHDDRRARRDAVSTIYSSVNIEEVRAALSRYQVRYVVVGTVEHGLVQEARLSAQALAKFDQHPEVFEVVFRSGPATLYATKDP